MKETIVIRDIETALDEFGELDWETTPATTLGDALRLTAHRLRCAARAARYDGDAAGYAELRSDAHALETALSDLGVSPPEAARDAGEG